MSTARTITKYPNRRLYDTEKSRYITLADIRNLILERVDFSVIDKRSGQDITRAILLQVISDLEQHGEPVMTRRFLSLIVQSHGVTPCGAAGEFLENSFARFLSEQAGVVAEAAEAGDGSREEAAGAVLDFASGAGRDRRTSLEDRKKAS